MHFFTSESSQYGSDIPTCQTVSGDTYKGTGRHGSDANVTESQLFTCVDCKPSSFPENRRMYIFPRVYASDSDSACEYNIYV